MGAPSKVGQSAFRDIFNQLVLSNVIDRRVIITLLQAAKAKTKKAFLRQLLFARFSIRLK